MLWLRITSALALCCCLSVGAAYWGNRSSRPEAALAARPRVNTVRQPDVYRVAALAEGSRSARYAELGREGAALWGAADGPGCSKPAGKPDWQVTVWRDGEARVLSVWSHAGVVAQQEGGEAKGFHRRDGMATLLSRLPKVKPLALTREQARKRPRVASEVGEAQQTRFTSVEELASTSEYITYGTIVGLADRYQRDPANPNAWTDVYLFRIQGLVKTQGERRIDFLRVQWPAGISGDHGQARLPGLYQGQSLILCTSHAPREWSDARGAHLAWLGEHAVTTPLPYGAIGVENGRTVSLDNSGIPLHTAFHFPEEVTLEGQPWQAFVQYLTWGLRPENRGGQHRPLPGDAGRLLVHPAPPEPANGPKQ